MISVALLFSEDCPQPELSFTQSKDPVVVIHYPKKLRDEISIPICEDMLKDGLLQLHLSQDEPTPLYHLWFKSPTKGHSWASKDMDFESAMSTYSELIYEEFC